MALASHAIRAHSRGLFYFLFFRRDFCVLPPEKPLIQALWPALPFSFRRPVWSQLREAFPKQQA